MNSVSSSPPISISAPQPIKRIPLLDFPVSEGQSTPNQQSVDEKTQKAAEQIWPTTAGPFPSPKTEMVKPIFFDPLFTPTCFGPNLCKHTNDLFQS